jgi:DNA-directed RNA polymerase II subunit RPB1
VLNACNNITRCGQQIEDGCGARQPDRYVKEGIARIIAEWDDAEGAAARPSDVEPQKVRQPLEVEYVLRIFRQILDEDVDFMGLSRHWCRPDWMICSTLSVPPPQMRPSVVQDNNQRSEDDLTHKLVDIIKTNKTLQQKIDANASKGIVDEWTNVLQYHVATLINNQIPGVAPSAQRSGRAVKSIQQRLGSKEGRIRYNIQGKRVEFSARSVITPDPNLSIGELGVPMKIAMNLTFPEKVTQFNHDKLYRFVQNGADVYPGAKTIVRADGRMISLKHVNTKELVLYSGDTVNRHIMDGDIILFNRQPTLHRMSMMGHRARVLPYNTFRLNVSAVSPYNADFDGDEMNAHIPQSYEASMELEEIAAVRHQIIGPREGKPSIGIVQDTLVGSYRLTKNDNHFTRREYMNLMMYNKNFEGLPKPAASASATPGGERYTGHQVVSSLLPPINMDMGNKSFDDDPSARNKVKIVEGQIVNGIIDKDIYSKAGKGIVHVSYNDYGSVQTVEMIDSLQTTIESFLVLDGFSVGISDMIADEKTRQQMEEVIQARKKEVNELNLQVHLDLFDNNTGKSNQDEFETRVFASLNKATKESGEFGQLALADENRLVAMVKAGSKGGPINIAQMIACVGQQNIEGRRIPYGFSDRTLPHYKKYDDGPEARGFIESSFIGGLTPQEFFFHAMSGREGLIDTAVKTADTGYIQRQLVKAMEDLTVHYDGTVRDTNMNIVQFHYGEDGLNATKIEGTSLSYVKLSEADIRREFGLAKVDFATILGDGLLTEDFADTAEVKTYVEQVLADRKMVVEGIFGSGRQGGVFAPLNLERLIMNLRVRFGLKPDAKTDLTPTYVLQGIDKLIQRTQPYHKLWCALLRFYFAPHKLIVKERFSKASFDTLCELCVVKDWKARSLPGELVGIIAAQSIGEPSTQMSSVYSTRIAVRNVKTNEHFVGPIGKLIDTILENDKSNVIQIGENSVVLDLDMENGYEIIGVSNDEKTSWKKISQVSRHPANGGLVEITTKSGRKTTATLTHSFLTRGPKGVIPILGSELKVGTRVPIARQIPEVASPLYSLTFELTKEFGWLCGIYLADGSLNGNTVCICKIHPIVEEKIRAIADVYKWDISVRNYDGAYGPSKNIIIHCKDLKQFLCKHFSSGSYEKKIAAPVFQSNLAFIQGIISGYFDGDGNVNVERQQIRVGSRSKTLIHDIAALLSYCGIFGSFGEETSIRIPGKILYTYQILKKYAAQFRNTVGLHLNEKSAALDAIVEYMERDGKHDTKEIYDKIPELGEIIAETGRLLTMPGQSRNFGRWSKKESIGRLTLQGYIEDFEEVLATRMLDAETDITIRENITLLRSAAYSDIVWDEIVELQILEDPKEFVYDFTVPGNDSFMVDDNILVHNTLNTFHLAGVAAKSNVTRGVPRLKELLKVTDNPKAISLSVYLKPEFRQNKDKAREVAQDLELTLLRDITVKTGIYYDPSDEKTIVGEDAELIEFYKLFEGRQKEEAGEGEEEEDVGKWSKWLLRLELDRERMFNKNISMDDISYILNYNFGQNVSLIYSDFNAKKLVMRIRLSIEDKSHGFGDDIAGLKKFQNKMLNGIVIRGVPGIRAVTFRKHADLLEHVKGEYKPIEQYVLDTDGSNFIEVMNHPAVDGSRIYSTHVHDIYCTLGVEATRAILLSELTGLFEEAGVNYRHLGILCDTMTRNGRLMSIDRYGINKSDNGPLAKASFEETEKILLKAALFGEIDPITGVSANIMTGQPIRAGTAFASILLDESALERMLQGLPPTEEGDDVEEDGAELTQEMIDAEIFEDTNDACATTQLRMNINLPAGDSMLDEPDGELTII